MSEYPQNEGEGAIVRGEDGYPVSNDDYNGDGDYYEGDYNGNQNNQNSNSGNPDNTPNPNGNPNGSHGKKKDHSSTGLSTSDVLLYVVVPLVLVLLIIGIIFGYRCWKKDRKEKAICRVTANAVVGDMPIDLNKRMRESDDKTKRGYKDKYDKYDDHDYQVRNKNNNKRYSSEPPINRGEKVGLFAAKGYETEDRRCREKKGYGYLGRK